VPAVTGGHRALFVESVLAGDRAGAVRIVDSAIATGASSQQIVAAVLAPAQRQVGALWEQAEITVAQEHMATAITEQCVDHLSRPGGDARGRVLLTGTEGEWHTLGARMVAVAWRSAGFDVVALTPSLPAADLGVLAERDPAAVAAVSCALPAHLLHAWSAISALRGAGLRVLAGGRAFDAYPHVAARLGADQYVADPFGADELIGEWARLPKQPRDPVIPAASDEIDAVLGDYERIVSGAVALAAAYPEEHLDDRQARQSIELLLQAALSAALTEEPNVALDHALWLRRRLQAQGLSATFASRLADSLMRLMPVSTPRVRRALVTTAHV